MYINNTVINSRLNGIHCGQYISVTNLLYRILITNPYYSSGTSLQTRIIQKVLKKQIESDMFRVFVDV